MQTTKYFEVCINAQIDEDPYYYVMYWTPFNKVPGSRTIKLRLFWMRDTAVSFADSIEPYYMIQHNIVGH